MITITFKLEDIVGAAAPGCSLVVTLCNYSSTVPRVPGTGMVAQTQITPAIAGDGTGSFTPIGNDVLTPGGTFYMVQVKNTQGGVVQANAYQFNGSGTFDLSQLTPISATPTPPTPAPPNAVVTNPTGTQIITGFPLSVPSLITSGSALTTTNQTGTGNLVLQTAPTISSPVLVTPAIQSAGASFAGATSGSTIVKAAAVASGTLTLPAATDTLVAKATTDTLTNKTLTAPVIGSGALFAGATSGNTTLIAAAVASGTLTLPAATDTLVAKATTDTLTNKTLTAPVIGSGALFAGATSGNTTLIAAAVASGTLTLPAATGTLALGIPKQQIFTATGTFTIPAGVTGVKVTLVGGGGAGGGATATNNGGGGGSGGAAFKWLSGLTPGNTIAVTIGAGGTGVSGAGGNGGGPTSISSGTQTITTITANGGAGGNANGTQSAGGNGGAISTNGDINLTGNPGHGDYSTISGAPGAGSIFGGGGNDSNGGNPGNAAGSIGGGGGGAGAGATRTGGAGASGIVIVEWVS